MVIKQAENRKKKIKENTIIYTIGAVGYTCIEILWRGNSHWTMSLTGGACFLSLYQLNNRHPEQRWWKKCAAGSAIITAIEFSVGVLVNRVLHWNVWDYSQFKFNLAGQVCLLYSGLWFLLCIPVMKLSELLKDHLFAAKKETGSPGATRSSSRAIGNSLAETQKRMRAADAAGQVIVLERQVS